MKSKLTIVGFSIAICLSFISSSCSKDKESINDQPKTLNDREIESLNNYAKFIVGKWNIDTMKIAKINYVSNDVIDTVLYNYGSVIVESLEPYFKGSDKLSLLNAYFLIGKDTLPIGSNLIPMPEKNIQDSITKILAFIDNKYFVPYPVPTNTLPISYQFLSEKIFNTNYILETSKDWKKWIWKKFQSSQELYLTKLD